MKNKITHILEIITDPLPVTYFNLFAELSKNQPDIKLSFVCLNNKYPPMLDDMKNRNCDCYWVRFNESNRLLGWIKAYFKLKKLFKKLKADVVHSHLFDDGVPAMLAAKHVGIKKRIHTKQCTTFHWFYAPKAVFLDRLINKWATNLIAVSNESKQFLIEKEKALPEKIQLIHHGISAENLKKAKEEDIKLIKLKYGLEGKIVVGTISRYIEWKGYKYIIEAAEKLIKNFPNLIFIGVGTGPQEEELKKIIKQKNLEKYFILTGWIDKTFIPAVFKSIDVYVHAAYMEPFGFVIPEAMINKIPIVTTPTGSALDGLKHMESAYIVEYNNSNELANGITYMITSNTSELVNKAYQSALNLFTIEKMWSKHLELYKTAK